MIDAKIVLDSISPTGIRLTTLELKFPRFILAEFNTHRAISRNAASSRAIPVDKFRNLVLNNVAYPVHWGENKPGMQATSEVDNVGEVKALWGNILLNMIAFHKQLESYGLHKQVANRILEPWLEVTVVASATNWDNMLFQRCDADAQPEFKDLADKIYSVLKNNIPNKLLNGQWHLPYVNDEDAQEASVMAGAKNGTISLSGVADAMEILKKSSAARCARVSYLNHNGVRSLVSDLKLFDKLVVRDNPEKPRHWSPLEHVATPHAEPYQEGNFYGWKQFRKEFSDENCQRFRKKGD